MAGSQAMLIVATAWLLLSVLMVVQADLTKSTATASSGQRLGQLRALVASSDNHGIVALDDNMFQQFAFAQARPYHIVVLLTSKQQTECSMCRQMESEFRVLAQAVEQLHVKPSNIFLAEADYDDNKRAFMTMGVTAIPYIVHFGDSASMPKLNPRTILQSEHVYEGSQTAVSAEDMSSFLRQHTHMHVEIVRGSWKGIGVVLAVLALALYLGTFYMDHLIVFGEMLRQAKRLWFTVCMIVYFIAISGIVYDVIRVPPPFYFDKNRQLAIFHPQSNQQFMLEGLITGLLHIVCAVSVGWLVFFVPKWRDMSARTTGAIVCMVAFSFTYMQVIFLYRMKAQWYRPF